jgi:SAM-dependent methyltransferase
LVGHPKARRVHYGIADVEFLPFCDCTFDTVLCVGVLQYLGAPDAALKELARVTRSGGQVIITFPNRRSPLNVLHGGAVSMLRAGRAWLRRVGIEVWPVESRLTFRDDIPNMSFVPAQIEAESGRVGFRPDCLVYYSLHFPFSIPGLRGPLRAWNHMANHLFRSGRLQTWGREVIVRLIRDG